MSSFKAAIAQIKEEYDIVDFISQSNVTLKKNGTDTYKGLCPFHSEKTPSFVVYAAFQTFKCFGCGAGGDVIDFAQKIDNLEFTDTVRYLAEKKNIDIGVLADNSEERIDLTKIYGVLQATYEFYAANFNSLQDTHPAKKMILERSLPVESDIFGYSSESPRRLYEHLKELGYEDEHIEASGMVIFKEGFQPFDFFHSRLMFVIRDYIGRPVSFQSRKLFDNDKVQGKYVNGKDTVVFHKKKVLYNLDKAKKVVKKTNRVYLLEGPFDVAALEAMGYGNAVASSGTAFTDDHANAIRRLVGESGEIVFGFDGDAAGLKALNKVFADFPVLHPQMMVIKFPQKMDASDFVKDNKAEELKAILESPIPIVESLLQQLKADSDMLSSIGRAQFVRTAILEYAINMKDTVLIDTMLRRVAMMSGTDIKTVRQQYTEVKSQGKTKQPKQEQITGETKETNPIGIEIDTTLESDKCFVAALSLLVRNPKLLIGHTPKNVPRKFVPFLKELGENFNKYSKAAKDFKFIVEEYTDSGFAAALQRMPFVGDPLQDPEDLAAHYSRLFNMGINFRKREKIENKRAVALGTLEDNVSQKEMIGLLKVLEDKQ